MLTKSRYLSSFLFRLWWIRKAKLETEYSPSELNLQPLRWKASHSLSFHALILNLFASYGTCLLFFFVHLWALKSFILSLLISGEVAGIHNQRQNTII